MCAQIDRDHKKYEERCERNVANAKKRYEKLHQEESQPAIACDRMPPHPNVCHNDNNSDNDNEHDNKTDTDDDNADALIISDACVSDYSFETVWSMYGKPVGNKVCPKSIAECWWSPTTCAIDAGVFAGRPLKRRSGSIGMKWF